MSEPLTLAEIEALERLEGEATPGEWGVLIAPGALGRWNEIYADGPQRVAVLSRANPDSNGAFIAAARNALPSLLSAARDLASLRAAVEALAVRVAPLGRASGELRWRLAEDLRALLPGGADANPNGKEK